MKRPLILAIGLTIGLMAGPAKADGIAEPGGTPEATALALENSDEYAWQLFFYMSRPAKLGAAGVADENKKFGEFDEVTPVVWETWALESGGAQSEVYLAQGKKPTDWDHLPARTALAKVFDRNREAEAVLSASRALPRFVPNDPLGQEVRTNRKMFEFITDDANQMYHAGGLEALLAQAIQTNNRALVRFPNASKEIKAQWITIPDDPAVKKRYFWREITSSTGVKQTFGLVSLHIITKDLPNWVWIDFGHRDCEDPQKPLCTTAARLRAPTTTSPVDSTTRGPNGGPGPSGAGGVRNETIGTVWENYVLRGAQTSFTTAFGDNIILSNPVIENTFQSSSCISCHARATVGPKTGDDVNTLSTGDPTLGPPNPTLFGAGPGTGDKILYLQTDFVWSAPFRAQRQP
jgi:hypothetical protein